MRLPTARSALAVLIGAVTLSCTDAVTSVKRPLASDRDATDAPAVQKPVLVISQIYGGGGNSGATYKNDFIELHNPGGSPVNVKGWSVQYASAAGTSWTATALTDFTVPPGGFYLIQESAGSGGTTALPTPDASASIAMSANNGKVALVASTAALSGSCPSDASVIDIVSFGTGNCGKATPALTNTTAALRRDDGCAYTGNDSTDFTTGAPTPRNSARSNVAVCSGALPPGPLDHLTIPASSSTVFVGGTLPLVAIPRDSNNQAVSGTILSWASENSNVASVDENGVVTGVAENATPVTIRATATDPAAGITKTATIGVTVTLPVIRWIDVSSSGTSFPPGFQTQLFATARTSQGGPVIDANFTFQSADPTTATALTYENTGIITGVGAGTSQITITATPKVGGATYTFTSKSITIEAPVTSPTSIYAKNDEFGDPTRADPNTPDDLLIIRPQYTLSYNESRGTPNWVAYELDARQIVPGQDRCNCFTADPSLPPEKQIFTADYTNGGYDRGHMTRSADRTTANADNASTYYLTNVVPQQGDLNQGVWAQFENALGDSATKGGRAVYIVTGPLYSKGKALAFLKGESKVAIPDSTWKIALIGPASSGNPFTRGSIQSWSDLANVTILAVNMPNVAGVRNDPWSKYLTTVDRIEQSTGYDFLSVIQTALQDALEANDHAPVAKFAVNGTPNEGAPVAFDASASTDADVGRADLGRPEALDYQWSFSDGVTGSGATFTRTFGHYGSVVATLTVTDAFGWPTTASQTINVQDVAPVVSSLPNALLITGESYNASGTFSDPGLDSWTATVDYNDGSAPSAVGLNGKRFTLSHIYHSAGQFRPTITVDDGSLQGAASATVTVQTPLAATQRLASNVQSFANAGAIVSQEAQPLLASLDAAQRQIARGNDQPAMNELQAFINKVNAAGMTGRMTTEAAMQLTDLASRVQRALTLD